MAGRGTLLVILGYTILFGLTGKYWTRVATNSVDNFVQYYNETTAHSIAESAANLGGSQVFQNQPGNKGFHFSGTMYGGNYDVVVDSVSQHDLVLTATGTYPPAGELGSMTDTVRVQMAATSFSTFGLYTETMNSLSWDTGDTIWGGFHSEGTFNVEGTPVFYGRVTSKNDMTGGGAPIIYGSFQTGLSIPMPSSTIPDIHSAASSGGAVINNPNSPAPFEVYMTANANGTVTFHTNLNAADSTVAISTIAPNGVIFVNNGNLHFHGTVSGQLTVGAGGSASNGLGSVYLNGSVLCNSDPRTNAHSVDAVGVVAQNTVWVESDNAYMGVSPASPTVNPVIEAAIYSQSGTFQCYYQSTSDYKNLGSVTVYGSVSESFLGVTSDPTGVYGYKPEFRFDPRYSTIAPPSFPVTGTYRILSWYE